MKESVSAKRTKEAFAQALKQSVRKKPLSKVTVSELVQACGVNRKTFYYHFQDLYDLLAWTLEAEAMEVVRQFRLPMDYERAIRYVMEYVERNDYLICCAYDVMGREQMKRFFYADFAEVITAAVEGAGITAGPGLQSFAVEFYTDAIADTLIRWAKERDRRNKEDVVRWLCAILGSVLEQRNAMREPSSTVGD